ncbi:MAG: D-alanyl-lipoteichoic acid biosynthesis protein DltD [Spirulina sp.]
MLDIEPSQNTTQPSSLSQWLYQAIQEPGVRLRIRLRGNNLHVLCEGSQTPELDRLLPRLTSALKAKAVSFQRFFRNSEDPIYKIVLYGRKISKQRPDWIESIVLERLQTPIVHSSNAEFSTPNPQLPISNEELARTGTPEAIARYLSEFLSHLGVGVKVLIQKLPDDDDRFPLKRLWVICSCHYSPDASLIAEPIAQQLRDLELEDFKEAIIRAQVRGEETPDWMLQVDLTGRSAMLREWGRWGDVKSIQCLLLTCFQQRNIQIGTILKDKTLHIFSSWREDFPASQPAPSREEVVSAISPLLNTLAPQGIETAEIYGLKTPDSEEFADEYAALLDLEQLQDRPVWVHRLELPAAKDPQLALSVLTLAAQKHPEALTFLLQRLLNPDIEGRLATGGIRIKLCFKDRLLHIMTEAVVCPRQTLVANKIEELLDELKIDDLAGARIYGRRSGQSSPLWSYGIDFEGKAKLSEGKRPQVTDKAQQQLLFPASPVPDTETVATPVATVSPIAPTLPQQWQVWREGLQTVLKATQLFVSLAPREEKAAIAPNSPRSSPQLQIGFPAFMTWLAIGCFLAARVDGGLTQWLAQRSVEDVPQSTLNLETAGDRETLSLDPEIWPAEEGTGFESAIARPTDNHSSISEERQAQKAAMLALARLPNSSFNNALLDEKLALYRERVKRWGTPDILIVGSSRALRGIDPTVLQKELITSHPSPVTGHQLLTNNGSTERSPNVQQPTTNNQQQITNNKIDIFNFGINGATAQVVHLLLGQILTTEELPKLIIWADGARAFNSGREDLTYEAIASSEGFRQLKQRRIADVPTPTEERWEFSLAHLGEYIAEGYQSFNRWFGDALGEFSGIYAQRDRLKEALSVQFTARIPSVENLHLDLWESTPSVSAREPIAPDGFLPLSVRFDPETYYLSHPKVAGIHDRDYSSFDISGSQYDAFQQLMFYLNRQQIKVVFVNLPLTHDYLGDPVRSQYEQEFQEQMKTAARTYNFDFLNLARRWHTDYEYFSDPSHLNRYGAYQVSVFLARSLIATH